MMESLVERLKALPKQSGETWQGGLFEMPVWIAEEGQEALHPYIPLWVAVQADRVHIGEPVRPDEGSLQDVLEVLADFACQSEFGGYRPGRLEVADRDLAEYLSDAVASAEIDVRLVDRLEAVERVLDVMEGVLGGTGDVPGPLEGRGVSIEHMRRFADAAAAFYRAAPWQHLTDADLVRIEKPRCPEGMKYAIVLGAGRSVYGLGFYRSSAHYVQFRRGAHEGSGVLDREGLWQVSFDPISEIPPKDADLWEQQELPVACDQAYPVVVRYDPAGELARPTSKRLAFVEGLLRAFAATTEAEIDSGRWHKEVTTFEGTTTVTLAIPDLLDPPSFQECMKRGFEPDRRAHERTFADMDRYFREHPPESIEEMNEAAGRLFTGKKIDDLVTRPETPLERAQETCYQAFDTHGRRRVQLARQALEICPDCTDAYIILAEQAGTLEAEIDHYTNGVAAGERVLGQEAFEEHVGHFWGVSSTRPYMRARMGLAQSLEQHGRIEEAVEHYRELLRLNPDDNQGVRYLLVPKLLQLGRDAEAARLLKQYDEQSANWAYAGALLAFRLSGRSSSARRELRRAFQVNPHVPEYLPEAGPLPMPPHYGPGSPEEALVCADELHSAFAETEGALAWLAAEYGQRQNEVKARRKEQRRQGRQKPKKRKH